MTALETPPAAAPSFPPAPWWRRAPLVGTAAGIQIEGANLKVAIAQVRPWGAINVAAFTIPDFRNRPASEWNSGLSRVPATVVLPRSEVIVRVAQFPGVADKDMPSAVALELDTLHPYGDEPVNWAWSRITSKSARPGSVLIGIVRAATLARYETLFREAGIPVSCITFSASAIYAALRLYSVPPPEFITWISESGEIYGESPSRAVFSADAGGSIPHALALGAAELRLPASSKAVALDTVLPPTPPADPRAWAAALAGAASWIARPANLLPPERRETVSRGRLIPTFVLAACVIAVVIALAVQKQFADRQYLRQLNQQIARLMPRAARSSAVDRRIAQTQARIDLLDRYKDRTKDDIEIINELTRLLPPPVWITSLEIHPDNVVIAGEADQAAPLLKVIDSSPLFRNSEFGMAVSRSGGNEIFRIKTMRRRPQ